MDGIVVCNQQQSFLHAQESGRQLLQQHDDQSHGPLGPIDSRASTTRSRVLTGVTARRHGIRKKVRLPLTVKPSGSIPALIGGLGGPPARLPILSNASQAVKYIIAKIRRPIWWILVHFCGARTENNGTEFFRQWPEYVNVSKYVRSTS